MKKSYIMIIFSAILWGTVGMFVRILSPLGFTTTQIVFLRSLITTIVVLIFILIKDQSLFKIKLRDLPLFIGSGLLSFVFFNFCYMSAIQQLGITVSAVLLYTAPIFVTILSAILFKDKLTIAKLIALVFAFLGCLLVSGIFKNSTSINILGIILGLGAGIGYALYSIFGRLILKKYSAITMVLYTFIIASVATSPFLLTDGLPLVFDSGNNLLLIILLGVLTGAAPYLLYTKGLSQVDASKASIIACVEPVAAASIGVIAFKERLTPLISFGIILILCAVFILNKK